METDWRGCDHRCPCQAPHFDGQWISIFSTGELVGYQETEEGVYVQVKKPEEVTE